MHPPWFEPAQDELEEVIRYVKPQHFLPVHGEYSFLCEHARLARERAGVKFTEVRARSSRGRAGRGRAQGFDAAQVDGLSSPLGADTQHPQISSL